MGVGRVLVAGMDGEEAAGGFDRLGVIARGIIAERAHQLRAPGPDRVGMLALDLVEQGGGLGIAAAVEPLLGGAVEGGHVAGDIMGVGPGALVAARAAGGRQGEDEDQGGGERTRKLERHGRLLSGG
jgi:hypothetical protein